MAEDTGRIVSISELKMILEREEEKKANMCYEKKMALEHARLFAVLSKDEADKMAKELMDIERITPEIAYKFTEILPTHPDDVRVVLAKERFEISEENINRIIEITQKYIPQKK